MGFIDLHVHTDKSDGKKSVRAVMDEARLSNVTCIALTEHYNLSSYDEACRIATEFEEVYGYHIEVIKGLEVGTDVDEFGLTPKKHKIHLLIYFPSNRIYKIMDEYEEGREKSVKRALKYLGNRGIELPRKEILSCARNRSSIGRLDIAATLVKRGIVNKIVDAYSLYLDNIPNVDHRKMYPTEAVKVFKKLGGVVVLAHPNSIKATPDLKYNILQSLKDAGLDGIEVYGSHLTRDRKEEYESFAREFDLITTVGSDYHGRDEIKIGSGIDNNLCIDDYSIVQTLKNKKIELDKARQMQQVAS